MIDVPALIDRAVDPRCHPPTVVDVEPGLAARRLAELDWDFQGQRTDDGAHALHPYPAKFIPQLARQTILALSNPGDLVVDPFSGGGTAALEAVATGRDSYGIDANPVGVAIGRAKTRPLGHDDERALTHFEATLLGCQREELLAASPTWLPEIPNVEKWYADHVLRALGALREQIVAISLEGARSLALVAFVQAAARLSFQESETRYSSQPREIDVIEVPRTLLSELRRMLRAVRSVPSTDAVARFVQGDARDPGTFDLERESAGLVVTSPPYPNAYDYHLYHRFRLFWLGRHPSELRRVEIGSHLKNQAAADPTGDYLADLGSVLENCNAILRPGRYAVLVVGEGLFGGELFKTSDEVERLAGELGYDHVVTLDRRLPTHRRSVNHAGRRLQEEQVVFLRKPAGARSAVVVDPNYRLQPYERELQRRELASLGGSPLAEDGVLRCVPAPGLGRAAFAHGIELADGQIERTRQYHAEGRPQRGSRRKSSTYLGHGLHRYKGKFYPQLAQGLLNLSGLDGDSLVLDPFGGSGTVALEATLAGIDAVSVDPNPLAVSIARAKLTLATGDRARLARVLEQTRDAVAAAPARGSSRLSQFADATLEELERWFPRPVLRKLDLLLATARHESLSAAETELLEVLVSDIVRDVSQQDPRDLRIRRRSDPIDDAPVYELFVKRVEIARQRLLEYELAAGDKLGRAEIVAGSSDRADTFDVLDGRAIDAVVSSPPYAAALPYIDTDRLSLAALFGMAARERRGIEGTMIGSREIGSRERAEHESALAAGPATLPATTLDFLNRYSEAVAGDAGAGCRLRKAPAVLTRYFLSMSAVLANVLERMRPGAAGWLVLGDSRSTVGGERWTIPTVDEVAAIAAHRGFELVERIEISVTRQDMVHSRNAITRNEIVRLRAPAQAQP